MMTEREELKSQRMERIEAMHGKIREWKGISGIVN